MSALSYYTKILRFLTITYYNPFFSFSFKIWSKSFFCMVPSRPSHPSWNLDKIEKSLDGVLFLISNCLYIYEHITLLEYTFYLEIFLKKMHGYIGVQILKYKIKNAYESAENLLCGLLLFLWITWFLVGAHEPVKEAGV